MVRFLRDRGAVMSVVSWVYLRDSAIAAAFPLDVFN